MEGPERPTPLLEGGRGGLGLLEGGLPRERHDGVDLGIHGIHAREDGLHHLEGRGLPRAVEALKLGGGRKAEIAVGH